MMKQSKTEELTMPDGFRIVREEGGWGRLRVEAVEPYRPSREQIDKALASVAKAYPYLTAANGADHIDGEFDNALTNLRAMLYTLVPA
jgi:hypothetical protein